MATLLSFDDAICTRRRTSFVYDALSQHKMGSEWISALAPASAAQTAGQREVSRLTSTSSPEGMAVGYAYDTKSNVQTVTRTPKPGSPLSPLVTAYTYDATYNLPTRITDPLGLVSTASYDAATGNLLATVADAGASPHLNARSSFTYDAFGQALTATDPLLTVTRYGYDAVGNAISMTRDVGVSCHRSSRSLPVTRPSVTKP
jgi:YD repeat-containing protein